MSYSNSVKKDIFRILLLFAATLFIFYPVFYTKYAYTDELVGLWQWRFNIQDSSATLLQYGRYITGKLAGLLFSSTSTIKELTWIRLFSLGGWLISIPVWYFVLKKIIGKEKLPEILAFFSVLYMICTPSVGISVGWAACFELSFGNTLGLLSGYFLYTGIRYENDRTKISLFYTIASILTGVSSLFIYQNCFGCFLLPFLLQLISKAELSKKIVSGVAGYFLVYVIYYILFKLSLYSNHIDESVRTGLHINVGNKLPFFLARPLSSAFHFTYVFNEKSIIGIIVYFMIAAIWVVFSFIQKKSQKITNMLKYFVFIFCLLGLIYLPSLVVKENYASNRTMFALSVAVFMLVAQTILTLIKNQKLSYIVFTGVSLLFIINAWFNFNKQYLQPVANEYRQVKNFIKVNYHSGIDTVYCIRPAEDFFVKKYGITRSWDEFGVPSTFFDWTPSYLVKQIILENTGNRKIAENLVVKSWLGKDIYLKTMGPVTSGNILVINVEDILSLPE